MPEPMRRRRFLYRHLGPAAAGLVALVLATPTETPGAPATVPASLPGGEPFPAPLRAGLAKALEERGSDYEPRTAHRRDDGSPIYTNRLLLESSPYLQQHAHNPVNWYPWGDEAFEAARALDRPVLVSIGYSTCHWCHVMEEESFDNPETAQYLNENFIAIKVDREVRPDVDEIYMTAIQAMNQRGGWPLNVWVTPDRKPFFAGTYFPPRDSGGRPGFPTVLRSITEGYAQDRQRIEDSAETLTGLIQKALAGVSAEATLVPGDAVFETARDQVVPRVDLTWGGVGSAPKFPSGTPIRFLLRYYRRTGDEEALKAATLTLEKMAAGGMYDQVGGGFHRYSTDARWLVPHFEKMLYDNALLALDYLEAWQVTGREDFARVAREILTYVSREMTAPGGGFYSATDADSPGPEGEPEEGWFFTWTPAEIDGALDRPSAAAVKAWYGVTNSGNHEGRNILHTERDRRKVAKELDLRPEELDSTLAAARERLYRVRSHRPPPHRDDKILVAWNGLMISAFARAGFAFGDERWVSAAARAADFALAHMRKGGRLERVYTNGRAQGPAFLDDYAFFIAGLIDLYEAQPDPRWLKAAIELQEALDRHYADTGGGGYFRTAADHEQLLAREKPGRDGAVPSGNSVAALNLLRLAELTGDDAYTERVVMLFSAYHELLTRSPTSVSELLLALDYYLDATKEIVVVRPASGGDLPALLAPLRGAFVPNRVLMVVTEGNDLEAHASLVPLVAGKRARLGEVTAYVCENRVCDFPTSDPAVFEKQIRAVVKIESD